MSKVLRICKSEDLPILADRDNNYVYFVYDKMAIYLGRNYYSDPFCVVEKVPDDPVEGMLYITMDGDMKTSIDSVIVDIGSIEDEEQKQYLNLAGTVYFMKAESRYLDLQTKTIQLPYQNGSYILTVSMAKDIMIDEDTIIRYDPESGEFVIDGNPYVDDTSGLPGLENYTGEDTSTIHTNVSNNQISANLKLSSRENNLLKVYGNGLYASIKDFASEEELNNLITAYANYKAIIDSYMEELREELEAAGVHVSEESINEKILSAMERYEPDIEDLLKRYDSMYQQIGLLRQSVTEYADKYLEEAKKEIMDYLQSIENSWSLFPGDGSSTSDQNMFTEEELSLQALLLAEFRKNLLYLREVEGTHVVEVEYFIITDDSRFDNVCDIKVLPKQLAITSNMSSIVGYSYITVSPAIEEGHKYLWKATDAIPAYNEDLTTKGYTAWDGTSEILVEDGAHVILIEADENDKAIKYGEFTAESRLEKPKELEILDVVSAEGTTMNYTELIVNPPLSEGNIYMLKKATTIPEYNTIISSDYEEWDGESEIKMDLYDMTMVCLVECTKDYHRALKVGLFPVDLANELLKRLRITSEAGTNLYYTKITSISPILSEDGYRIKTTKDRILPKVNAYVDNPDWLKWDGLSEILCELGDNLIIVEVDADTKVKKAGVITPIINNSLTVTLTYDEMLPNINHVFVADQTEGSNLYYHVYNPNEEVGITALPYGAEIDENDYALIPEDGFGVSDTDNKISIVEELNGVVYRSCIVDAVLEKPIGLTITSTAGSSVGFTSLSVLPTITESNQYYIKILLMDDGAKYAKNELVDVNEYNIWDGTSEIDLSQDISNDSLFIRVVECTTDNRIVGYGTVVPVYTTE